MEITTGWILIGISAAGILVCIFGLLAAGEIILEERERGLEKKGTEKEGETEEERIKKHKCGDYGGGSGGRGHDPGVGRGGQSFGGFYF